MILMPLLATLPALAQSVSPVRTASDVVARLEGQPLMLRGFWTADELAFDAKGRPAEAYPTGSFTLSGFREASATIEGQKLTVTGDRIGLEFDENGKVKRVPLRASGHGKEPEEITLHLAAASDGDFGPALDAIFATRLRDIAPTLPEVWQAVAEQLQPELKSVNVAKSGMQAASVKQIGGSVMPPKLRKSVDPVKRDAEVDEAARRLKFSGQPGISFLLEKDGRPDHIRIVHPAGLGLDEMAADAVSQYTFDPATQNGQPVIVELYVVVNFHMF